MNRVRISVMLTMAVMLLQCTNLSGPGGEGNGSETVARGVIVDSTGAPAAGVPVQLLPVTYDPVAPDTIPEEWQAFTNSKGEYHLAGIGAGSFVLEASSISTGMKALVKGIETSGGKTEAVVDTGRLGKTGTVFVQLQGVTPRTGDYVYLPGTSTFTRISNRDSVAGQAVLSGVPAGTFTDIMYVAAANSLSSNLLSDTITVRPGDTVASAYAAWKYNRQIVLNTSLSGADISGTVSDFPVLVRLNGATFDFSQAQSGGKDLRFAKPDGLPLVHEVERWNAGENKAEIWVKVDTIYGNNGMQTIKMYWGNAAVGGNATSTAVFDTANRFLGVWHMNDDPAGGTGSIKDRTVNAHHATPFGSMTAAHSIEGAVGTALAFDGIDDYLNAGDVPVPGTYSMGLWVMLDTAGKSQRFIYKDSSYTLWYAYDTTHSVRAEHMSATTWWRGLLQDGGTRVPMVAGTWYYLAATFDGSVIRLYENGAEVSRSNEISVLPIQIPSQLFFGKYRGNLDYVDGIMDEIRIEGVARSPDWIKLCYMNQRRDDLLVTFR